MTTNDEEVKPVVRYKWEYGQFLDFVKKGKVGRAVIYAKALKIDRKTLVHWLSQPELREAMIASIDELVEGMQRAGKNDWRMYRELLKMIGVDDEQIIDIKSDGEAIQPATIIDLGNLQNVANKPEASTDSPDN